MQYIHRSLLNNLPPPDSRNFPQLAGELLSYSVQVDHIWLSLSNLSAITSCLVAKCSILIGNLSQMWPVNRISVYSACTTEMNLVRALQMTDVYTSHQLPHRSTGPEHLPHFLSSLRLVSHQQDNHCAVLVWSTSSSKAIILHPHDYVL